MKRRMMVVLAVLLMLAAVIPVIAGGLERGPVMQTQVVKEHRAEYWMATGNEWLTGVLDTTTTYVQSIDAVDEMPTGWGLETWSLCKTQVPDSTFHQMRSLVRAGGTWGSWANVDTTLASAFTIGVSVHRFKRLVVPEIKPWALQFRDIAKDASAACSSQHHHIFYTWPE